MSEYDDVLASYRAEIIALEARARELRDGWGAPDEREAREREAQYMDEEARQLRRALPAILRATFGEFDDDVEEEPCAQEEAS